MKQTTFSLCSLALFLSPLIKAEISLLDMIYWELGWQTASQKESQRIDNEIERTLTKYFHANNSNARTIRNQLSKTIKENLNQEKCDYWACASGRLPTLVPEEVKAYAYEIAFEKLFDQVHKHYSNSLPVSPGHVFKIVKRTAITAVDDAIRAQADVQAVLSAENINLLAEVVIGEINS